MSIYSEGSKSQESGGGRRQFNMREFDELTEKIGELLDDALDTADFSEHGEPQDEGE